MPYLNYTLDKATKLGDKFQVNKALNLKQTKRNPSEFCMSRIYENEVVVYTNE